ncbi:leucine-rich repeat domain-containing protein [Lacihabitans sp. LS3-19]|uniref:leucine-rich repeat domain-containing protein n=1 Tax=Lacihabitans sp. LS3-19 TaxID=2487335 RepID=UPI0020CC71C3|nr:leucine-rich repeat domain-containing protein [Lacihabitans sp. LS3-19]MCP9767028.1 leucine-rich repeat domain-containing protein [Lacihabitans sp. LS3-19]
MKTLLVSIGLFLSILTGYSQKIIFLENQSQYELFKAKESKVKETEEMKKGIWRNNSRLLKLIQMGFLKEKGISGYEDEVSLFYRANVTAENKIDSIYYFLGKHNISKVGEKTTFDFEYQPVRKETDIIVFNRIIENALLKNKLFFEPYQKHEFSGGVRINQYKSKNQGLQKSAVDFLASQSDSLKVLKLVGFGLKELPEGLNRFKNITELDLSKNEFESFKFNPKDFPKLKRIVLSENLLSEKSIKIKRNRQIELLNLSDNDLFIFPKKIQRNRNLKDLHLANNFLSDSKNMNFKKFKNLELLNFYNNQIDELPESISKLQNLQILDLYHNDLRFLPNSFIELKKLQTLAISNNRLWQLPAGFEKLDSLKVLFAHHNKFTSLAALPSNLEHLDLGFNLLEDIPQCFSNLQKVDELDISNNKIKSGAEILQGMKSLEKVYLALNNFDEDPKKFAELQQIIVDLEKKSVVVK